jgi:phage FluMu protein gp41
MVFSQDRSFSQQVNGTASQRSSPAKPTLHRAKTTASKPNVIRYNLQSVTYDDEPFSASTTFSKLIPRPAIPSEADSSQSLAERRKKAPPTPIHIPRDPRFAGTAVLQHPQLEHVSHIVSPLSPREMYEAGGRDVDQQSGYTSNYSSANRPEPLRIRSQQADIFDGNELSNVEFEKSHG